MTSLFLAYFLLLFIPPWVISDLTLEDKRAGIFSENIPEKAILPEKDSGGEILGENDENKFSGEPEKRPGTYDSFFSSGKALASGMVPVRKEGVSDLKIWSGASVAIDSETGTVLHFDNGKKRVQVASLTKMMTAILAVEKIKDLEEEVTITRECLSVPGTVVGCPTSVFCNGNRMYAGEKVRAIDLLKATLLNSANDAATALAVHMDGSVEEFAETMNERAREMGLRDTNFCTPSGLETPGSEDNCYSTAYDIARVGAFSMKYDIIWDIMKISESRFYSSDGKYVHELKNTVILMEDMPGCLGGKTGFTPLAGKSLLVGAVDETKKNKIVIVTLNDQARWETARSLARWVFNSYEWK